MTLQTLVEYLNRYSPPALQESYDNVGLLCGDPGQTLSGVLVSLDVTEAVVSEAIRLNCNLIVAHHPLIFKGLKKITGSTPVERTLIEAIRQGVALYACHTNLDNQLAGVNGALARKLGLEQVAILNPKTDQIFKLETYIPHQEVATVQAALFKAGAGSIGNYSECSFISQGMGAFTPMPAANPRWGQIGEATRVEETKLELVFPAYAQSAVLSALFKSHPYETPAYSIYPTLNAHQEIGSGLIGLLPNPLSEPDWLEKVAAICQTPVVRHSPLTGKTIQKVALCGGAGSFLISKAKSAGADAYLTADLKYHDFFEADQRVLLTDPGHFESEQYTIDLLHDIIKEKFPTFAVLKTSIPTNPVGYYVRK